MGRVIPNIEEAIKYRNTLAKQLRKERLNNPQFPKYPNRKSSIYQIALLRYRLSKIPESHTLDQKIKAISNLIQKKENFSSLGNKEISEILSQGFKPDEYSSVVQKLIENNSEDYIYFFLKNLPKEENQQLTVAKSLLEAGKGLAILRQPDAFPNVNLEEVFLKLYEQGQYNNLEDFLFYVRDYAKALRIAKDLLERNPSERVLEGILQYHAILTEDFLETVLNYDTSFQLLVSQQLTKILVSKPEIVTPKIIDLLINSGQPLYLLSNLDFIQNLTLDNYLKLRKNNNNENYINEAWYELLLKISDLDQNQILRLIQEAGGDLGAKMLKYLPKELITQEAVEEIYNLHGIDEVIFLMPILTTINFDEIFRRELKIENLNLETITYIFENINKFPSLSNNKLNDMLDLVLKYKITNPNFIRNIANRLENSQKDNIFKKLIQSGQVKFLLNNLNLFPNQNLQSITNYILFIKDYKLILENEELLNSFGIDNLQKILIDNNKFDILFTYNFPNLDLEKFQDLVFKKLENGDPAILDSLTQNISIIKNFDKTKFIEILVNNQDLTNYSFHEFFIKNFIYFSVIDPQLLTQKINIVFDSQHSNLFLDNITIFKNSSFLNLIIDRLVENNEGLALYLTLKINSMLTPEIYEKIKKFAHFETVITEVDGKMVELYSSNPYESHKWNPDLIDSKKVTELVKLFKGELSELEIVEMGIFDPKLQKSLENIRLIFQEELAIFKQEVRRSQHVAKIESVLIFSDNSPEMVKLEANLFKNFARYVYQITGGDPEKIKDLLINTTDYLVNFKNSEERVLDNELSALSKLSLQGDVDMQHILSDRGHHAKELKFTKDNFRSLIKEALAKYLQVYEVDIPLYDIAFKEFDDFRFSKKFSEEVYLGRDGIYAKIGRRSLIVSALRRMGREERIRLKREIDSHLVRFKYLVYPRFFIDNVSSGTLEKYLEQHQISVESNPLFYDTGFAGTIPENIMSILKFDTSEIDKRIQLLSSNSPARTIKNMPHSEGIRRDIVNLIERNSKIEGAAEGLYYDSKSRKITHIAKPLSPEQQFFFAEVKESLERHYWAVRSLSNKENAIKLLQNKKYEELMECINGFSDINQNEIILEIIANGGANAVINNLNRCKNLNNLIARTLINQGFIEETLHHLSLFPNIDANLIIEIIQKSNFKDKHLKIFSALSNQDLTIDITDQEKNKIFNELINQNLGEKILEEIYQRQSNQSVNPKGEFMFITLTPSQLEQILSSSSNRKHCIKLIMEIYNSLNSINILFYSNTLSLNFVSGKLPPELGLELLRELDLAEEDADYYGHHPVMRFSKEFVIDKQVLEFLFNKMSLKSFVFTRFLKDNLESFAPGSLTFEQCKYLIKIGLREILTRNPELCEEPEILLKFLEANHLQFKL